jgi:hypothetical protein
MFSDQKMWKHNNVCKCIQNLAKFSWIQTLHVSQPANFCFHGKDTFHIKVQVFWDITPCSLVYSYWHLRRPCHTHLQGSCTHSDPEDGGSKLQTAGTIYQLKHHHIPNDLNFNTAVITSNLITVHMTTEAKWMRTLTHFNKTVQWVVSK